MMKDEAYPYGWSHRRFFPKKNDRSVPPVDPAPKKLHIQSESVAQSGASGSVSPARLA